jgi:hypothetical protein
VASSAASGAEDAPDLVARTLERLDLPEPEAPTSRR